MGNSQNSNRKKPLEANQWEIGFGTGVSRSVVFLTRNTIEYNDALGYHFLATFNKKDNLLRYDISFTTYRKIQIEPTWKDVTSWITESNVHFIANFINTDAILFPFLGICLSKYRGYFTGISDVQGLRSTIPPNTWVNQYWGGLNVGVGFEKIFYPWSVGGSYKMRISNADLVDRVSIVDVCFNFFIKFYFIKSKSRKLLGPRGRYILETTEN